MVETYGAYLINHVNTIEVLGYNGNYQTIEGLDVSILIFQYTTGQAIIDLSNDMFLNIHNVLTIYNACIRQNIVKMQSNTSMINLN